MPDNTIVMKAAVLVTMYITSHNLIKNVFNYLFMNLWIVKNNILDENDFVGLVLLF